MNQSKIKALLFTVGGLTLIATGLLYILVTDLFLLNTAEWLFAAIFVAFGAGFSTILSESVKNKHVWFYIIKSIGIVCSFAFVLVIFKYAAAASTPEALLTVVKTKGYKTAEVLSLINLIKNICLVLSIFGIACQAADVVLNIVYKIDD
jgi:hypothetical protein